MLPETISITDTETEPCVCCEGDSAKRTSVDPDKMHMAPPQQEDLDIDADFIECHVCGYAWYEMDIDRPQHVSVVNVVHDVNSGIPGQPARTHPKRMPSLFVTAKPTRDVAVNRLGDIEEWTNHFFFPLVQGAQRKPIPEKVFNHELGLRLEERQAVARN
jgi:hypothetical protein